MTERYDYDVIILGSGPGGYVAGIRARQLGLTAAVIEKASLGGVCLNIGCIPSKALIGRAERFAARGELEAMGVRVDAAGLDYAKVHAASRTAAETLSKGVRFLLKKNTVDLVTGTGRITRPHEVAVKGGATLTGKSILIATGSAPRELPGMPFDERTVLSSSGLLMRRELPASLVVLGSGYIGMELTYVMNAFGVDVHVVEMLDRILPQADPEAVRIVQRAFRRRGVKFTTSARAVKMATGEAGASVTLETRKGTQIVEAEAVLVAVGRVPNSEGIGLASVGIEADRGFVPVGDYYQTAAPGVYAVGDVIDSPMLAHVASKEAEIAVEHIAGRTPARKRLDPLAIPSGLYCEPQLACFGYTEPAAVAAGVEFAKATFPYRGLGKAVAVGRPDGMVKILYAPDTRAILGAHIAGAEATELIHELLLASSAGLALDTVAEMTHAHPTLSEALMEAARAATGGATHV